MKRAWFSVLPLVMILSGCSLLEDNNGPLDEMRAAKRRWERLDINNYSYEFQMSCECLPHRKIRINVVADTVDSATYVDDGSPVDRNSHGGMVLTIDGVFDWLIEQLRYDPDQSSAWFDPTHYFPKEVYMDRVKSAVDDEFWLYMSALVILDK